MERVGKSVKFVATAATRSARNAMEETEHIIGEKKMYLEVDLKDYHPLTAIADLELATNRCHYQQHIIAITSLLRRPFSVATIFICDDELVCWDNKQDYEVCYEHDGEISCLLKQRTE